LQASTLRTIQTRGRHGRIVYNESRRPWEALPFDADAARAYGRVFAAITGAGRKARGKRAIDLLIAATALSVGLPLYTRNIDDFSGLEGVVDIVEVPA